LPPGYIPIRRLDAAARAATAAGLPLGLALSDRDFTADDYDALLALDERAKPKGLSKSLLSRLKIEVVPEGGLLEPLEGEGEKEQGAAAAAAAAEPEEEEDDEEEQPEEEEGGKKAKPQSGKQQQQQQKQRQRLSCAVCMCEFEGGDKARRLPCGHLFHAAECIDRWLESHVKCPVCTRSVEEMLEEEKEKRRAARQQRARPRSGGAAAGATPRRRRGGKAAPAGADEIVVL